MSCLIFTGCMDKYLDVFPEDKISSANFPENEEEVKMMLNGIYSQLRESDLYLQGLFGFGITDGATPNAFNWETRVVLNKLGRGEITSGDGEIVTFRWTRCYEIISRANYLLSCLEAVGLPDEVNKKYLGESHFLRGLAYSILAETYGGVAHLQISVARKAFLNQRWTKPV